MKTKITLLILFLSLTFVNAQHYPPVSDSSQKIEEQSKDIVDAYDRELAMTAKQRALFQLKVEDYLMLRKKIESNYDGREELDALVEMQAQETLDMNDILTRIQMQLYKKIKPTIQPLKEVEN
ncbi:hypothetical protein [Psychroserpens mesophilus]|uniref:hypothetical protein n=1 Tax=Psychroserpens mesophilus TaxID=325473 RepID=UPI003D65B6BD